VSDITSTAAAPSFQRTRVAGRDLAALLEGGLELGQLFESRVRTGAVVLRDLGAVRQSDRHDLAGEVAVLLRPYGQLLGALRVLVHIGAAHLVAFGHVLRRKPHGDVRIRPAVPALEPLVLILRTRALDGLVVARHPLDPGGDIDIALAGPDGVGGLADRFEAGGAVA
jgi:hypothetical protein